MDNFSWQDTNLKSHNGHFLPAVPIPVSLWPAVVWDQEPSANSPSYSPQKHPSFNIQLHKSQSVALGSKLKKYSWTVKSSDSELQLYQADFSCLKVQLCSPAWRWQFIRESCWRGEKRQAKVKDSILDMALEEGNSVRKSRERLKFLYNKRDGLIMWFLEMKILWLWPKHTLLVLHAPPQWILIRDELGVRFYVWNLHIIFSIFLEIY